MPLSKVALEGIQKLAKMKVATDDHTHHKEFHRNRDRQYQHLLRGRNKENRR
jgi:hypothetical protein